MIVTPSLVYIHMPKTGGMWVAYVLHNIADGHKVRAVRRHGPLADVPSALLEGRILAGSIRDPWSWYTSPWQHLRSGVDGPPILRAIGDGDQSFNAFLRGVCDNDFWPALTPEQRPGWPWPPNLGGGLYTSMVRWFFGMPFQVNALIDLYQLREGLGELIGQDIDTGRFPPKNSRLDRPATAVKNPHTLYQNDQVALVQQVDGETAFALGYTEPFAALQRPVLRLEGV